MWMRRRRLAELLEHYELYTRGIRVVLTVYPSLVCKWRGGQLRRFHTLCELTVVKAVCSNRKHW